VIKVTSINNLKEERFILAMVSVVSAHHSGEGMAEESSLHGGKHKAEGGDAERH
jgi:hypothetical protein